MLSHVVLVVTTLLTLLVPGAAVGWSLGLRASTVLTAAPALTLGLVTVAGTVASAVAFPWNPAVFAVATVVLCGLIVLVRRAWRARSGDAAQGPLLARLRRPAGADVAIAAGVALGWLVSAATLYRGFGSVDAPNQDWDYVFHANATRLIADSGDMAPSALRAINNWELDSFFYPNAFHGYGAIVRDLTGAPIFDVLNAQTMMIAGVAGLGLAGLLRRIGAPTVVSAATPVLLAGFASFPYDLVWRGPVLPYALGVALLPAFFVVLLDVLDGRRIAAGLAGGLAAASLMGVQTSVALSAALAAVPLLVQRWAPGTRTVLRDLRGLALVAVSALVLALPYVTGVLSVSGSGALMDWPAVETFGQAVGDLVLLDHDAAAPQYWLAGLMIVGLLTVGRLRSMWWWLAAGAIAVGQFALTASSDSPLVQSLTGPWWNDRYRFAALAVLGFAPLAAAGLYALARGVGHLLQGVRRWSRYRVAVPALVGLVGVVVLSNGLYFHSNDARVAQSYQNQHFLDANEISAMGWLARQPEATSGMVMNDPSDGSAYLWAVGGVRPTFGHILTADGAEGIKHLLLARFNCLDSDDALRRAVQDLRINYVFVSSGYVRSNFSRSVGLRDLDAVRSLAPVYDRNGVQIYRVSLTADGTSASDTCGRTGNP